MKANKPGPSSSSPPKQDARTMQPFTSWSDETQPGYKNIHARSLRMGKRKHEDGHISDNESISEQNDEKPQRSLTAEIVVKDVNEHNSQIPLSPEITFNEPRDYDPIISSSPLVYIRDLDGEYNKWNNSLISNMLKRRDSVVNACNYNSYIISAYHYVFEYYIESSYVRTYDRKDLNLSILPCTFVYKKRVAENEYSHEMKMFGFHPNSPHHANHRRLDVINCNHSFMKTIYNIGRIAFGAIITMNTDNHDFPDFSIDNLYYIPVETNGHYHSQQYDLNDYVRLMEAISQMDYKHNDNTNQVYTDTLLLALMWDFQVWVAQVLSSVHFSIAGVAYLRQLIVTDIVSNKSRVLQHLDITNVLLFFAMNVSPFYNPTTVIYCNARYLNKYEDHFRNGTRIQFLDPVNVRQSTVIEKVFLQVFQTVHINSIKNSSQRFIIDTGASVSATSQQNILTNIIPCTDMVAYPAFGPQIQPSLRGEFGKFALDTVVIDNMPDTLISVSQLCEGGNTQKQNVAIFTTEGVRVFEFDSIRTALKLIDSTGIEVLRGFTEEGIYVAQNNNNASNVHNLYMAKFRPISIYDHVHMITGHPGEKGMKWHRENSLNGKYTDNDLNRNRGVCQGCVYGGAHQTPTDPYRDHRPIPLIPGQCFTLDAYTHSTRSSRGHLYCDIFTDLATRRHYPVFTKDRSAHELCEKTRQLFIQHPQWKLNASRSQERFIRLDSESSYKSIEFLTFASSIGYILEHTPVRDKHAGGIAERAVGVISAKTNVAMMAPVPPVPQPFWDYAMTYACDTHSYNYCSAIGTSPYMKITGKPVNLKYLQPFWASCYVYIPLKERYKIGDSRAYKAHFVGYANTTLLFPNYVIIPVSDSNNYMRHKDSKDVIFDPTINFSVYTADEEPYDREFVNTDHYIPFLERVNAPDTLRGPNAIPNLTDESDVHTPIIPVRGIVHNNETNTVKQSINNDTEPTLNEYNIPYDDDNGSPVYWYQLHVKNYEYPLAMCETQNFYKIQTVKDPLIPQNFYKAMKQPLWEAAIDKELTKFEKNMCLQVVPYNGQHMVPMMWTFVIKTDGTKKARLVGRGDLMIPNVDFDPNAVYCGNVTACSIKMCVTIAAVYKLNMKGGDLEGAYLVTRANPDYPVYIKTPQGYSVPKGMCIQAIGNLYGFPPAGQNFSVEFDKCVFECGYKNTPWDLKFFYKWKNNKPMLLIVHSDDFRWFGDSSEENEWKLLVDTFEKHKYKVSDVTDSEFVGIQITHDDKYNYYMNQTRMIDEIISEAQMKQAKDAKLPYPLQGEALSKLDNATEKNYEECQKFPYRRIVGQLMYGMVHTMVTIAYALNVLSRYGNNPGPRHIEFLKHLLKYVRSTKTDRLKFITHDGPQDIETMTKILQLRFQCDADLAGNLDTKHSQTSYLGYLGDSLICWCSTDQGSMSTSTAESEMKAVNHTLKCEVIANRGILNQMGWLQQPTIIEEDNKACVDASVVPHMTRGMRHLDITQNFLKEKFADGTCVLKKIDSKNNNADIGTKRLPFPIFDYLTYPFVDRSLRPQKKYDKEE